MTFTYSSVVLTKSLGVVFQTMRLGVSFYSIMIKHVEAFQWEKDNS